MSTLRLATRRSPLALQQATYVQQRLTSLGVTCELVHIETQGDIRRDVALDQLAGQGVFAVEIQAAVLRGAADVAVHSAKDLPSTTPDGLTCSSDVRSPVSDRGPPSRRDRRVEGRCC